MSYAGLGNIMYTAGEYPFCQNGRVNPSGAEAIRFRDDLRRRMVAAGIPVMMGLPWQKSEQDAWNAYNVRKGLKPMLFGKYPMGTQCRALPAQGAKSGDALLGFGGTYAPDCWLQRTGRADAPGKLTAQGSQTSAQWAAAEQKAVDTWRTNAVKTYGEQIRPILDKCQGSADPGECFGQNVLAKPFLGRSCKPEWMAWAQLPAAQAGGGTPPPAYQPALEQPTDNTLLYAGVGAVLVLGVGAYFVFKK